MDFLSIFIEAHRFHSSWPHLIVIQMMINIFALGPSEHSITVMVHDYLGEDPVLGGENIWIVFMQGKKWVWDKKLVNCIKQNMGDLIKKSERIIKALVQ